MWLGGFGWYFGCGVVVLLVFVFMRWCSGFLGIVSVVVMVYYLGYGVYGFKYRVWVVLDFFFFFDDISGGYFS